jgi:HlyD family secretion protein
MVSLKSTRSPAFFAGQKRLLLWSVLTFVVIGAGAFAYYWWVYRPNLSAAAPTVQTATARRGDLIISASGTGALLAPEDDLSFTATGQVKVTHVYVEAGDTVEAGKLLVEADSTQAQVDYDQAKNAYDSLTSLTAIADARTAIANAQTSLDSARNDLEYLISPEVVYWETQGQQADEELRKAQARVDRSPSDPAAQQSLQAAKDRVGFMNDQLAEAWKNYYDVYVPETFPIAVDRDKDTYLVPTDLEIQKARTAIGTAETQLKQGKELLAVLTGGAMPESTTNPGLLTLEQAQRALADAQANLDGTKIVAPIAGRVVAVNATEGSKVGTRLVAGATPTPEAPGTTTSAPATIIVLADTTQPYILTYWDPSDWDKVRLGNDAQITFDNLPDQSFSGKVSEVDKTLYISGNTTAVQGQVSLDASYAALDLPLGATASVEVISQSARNAVLIPVGALHEISPGKYEVFVVTNGKLELRSVEVGLQDQTNAQITSGLQPGEVVSTGLAQTQ